MRAIALGLVLLLARALAMADRDWSWSSWTVPALVGHDLTVALAFGLCDRLAREARWVWVPYAALVAYVALNVPVIRALSSPLTVPMLRAAGGPLRDSIAAYATAGNLLRVAIVLGAAIVLPVVLARISPRARRRFAIVAAIGAMAGPVALARVDTVGLHRNAVTAIVATAVPRIVSRAGEADWRISPFGAAAGEDLTSWRGAAAGFNVLLIVLESAGAGYLAPYGAGDDPMPNLTALARQSIVVEHAYAVYPESIKGLFALLCARDPGFDVSAETHAAVACDALPARLRDAGHRTAVFHSGRFAYLGMQEIIDRLGFETSEDAGAIGGNVESSFGVDEPATVARLLAWLDGPAAGRPFFVTYLPVAGHHPYATNEPGPFTGGDDLTAYKNALFSGDRALGTLVDGLRTRGFDSRTLIVIVGDHGEAFGQHAGNIGHTQFIYEENVRVPLVIAGVGAPARVSGHIASVVDIAPTVLDLLGMPRASGHEGVSLITPGGPGGRMALFFTDYAIGWLGLRDGCWKFVHAVEAGRSQLFDLCRDPVERVDVAAAEAVRVGVYRDRVLAWSAARRAGFTSPARGTPPPRPAR